MNRQTRRRLRRQMGGSEATQDDSKRREVSALSDVVEVALARPIDAEVEARGSGWEGRVAVLAEELRTRRLARAGVAMLELKRHSKKR